MKNILTLLLCLFSGVLLAQKEQKPNIIFILADDMGYGDIEPYGQKIVKTPHLSKLANEGMTFTDFYAGSTVCAPSRASLLTGQHTGRTKVRGNGEFPLDENKKIFPELLKEAGYQNAIFGKWGMGLKDSGSTPLTRGFDAFAGFLHHMEAHRQTPDTLDCIENGKIIRKPLAKGTYANEIFITETLDFIRDNASKNPFFIYLSLTVPHAELSVAQHYMKKQLDENKNSIHPNEKNFKGGHYGAQKFPKAAYAAMVNGIDDYVGQISALVEKLGIERNTVIVFSSDNGTHIEGGRTLDDVAYFQSSGIYRGTKRDLYEGGIREPFIVQWKGTVPPNTKSDFQGAFWDIYPTFAEMAGIRVDKNDPIDGISFMNTLKGNKKQKKHKYLYWEFYEFGGKQAVRYKNWKAVRVNVDKDKNAPIELYDLSKDPSETNNIAGKYPKMIKKLTKFMEKSRTSSDIFKYSWEKTKK
ncbi:MAG: arylsulfatase [Capnocytophaga felis]|nr:arylsulfatase [Capnocytophaga felis]